MAGVDLDLGHGGMPPRVGKYRIDHPIGRGAIGVVYKGYDEQIDRPLAIKTLRPEVLEGVGENDEVLRRFAAEARSAGRCLHPNIVTVFDYVEHAGAPYIVMEYVNAGTLENVIRSGTLLPVRQVGEIMAQLLFALDHAHRKGIIHRDVKPANILCPSSIAIKVTDFGIAHIEALDITKPGGVGAIGTPNYMAPERFLGRPADARSDLFSAGVILFQLLTGARPFIAGDVPQLMHKLINEFAPSILTFRPELWPSLDVVVQRALARNPEDRFPSAEAFIDALNAAIDTRPLDNTPPLDLTKLSQARREAPPPGKTDSSGSGSGGSGSGSGTTSDLSQTMAERLSPDTIDALGKSLARSLGPMARLFVRQASLESTDVEMLLNALTRLVKTEPEAKSFRDAAERFLMQDQGIARAQIEAAITQKEIEKATDALMPLIGPVARLLVARNAQTAVGRDDFFRRLSEAIPNEKDRARFLLVCGREPGHGPH